MIVALQIPISPVAKARPRVTFKGKPHAYNTEETKICQEAIRMYVWGELVSGMSIGEFPVFGKEVPLKLTAWFYVKKPKSCPKLRTLPLVKPDLNNFLSLLQDAIKGVVYHDDSQITSFGEMGKRYGEPHIVLKVEPDKEAI